jgi:hypothetical protein
MLDVPTGHEQVPARLVAQVAAAAANGHADGVATYAFVPRFRFGRTEADLPEPLRDARGQVQAEGPNGTVTVRAHVSCPFSCQIEIYEVPSGKRVAGYTFDDTLTRTIEYSYDRHDSVAAIQYKAAELGKRIGIELVRSPRDAFASQAASAAEGFGAQLVGRVRELEAFKLQAGVISYDAGRDWVLFNLGTGLSVHADDWFRLERDGKEIGMAKIRAMDPSRSAAQPVFLELPVRPGDRVVEVPKANAWHGLEAGALVLNTGVLATAGYGMQWDIGPTFSLSELYLTFDAYGLTGGPNGGFGLDLGLAQKYFSRRWGFSWGGRVGGLSYAPLTNNAIVPAGQLLGEVDCFLTPWLVWNAQLGAEAVWPVATAVGGTRYPLGALARTGLSFNF